MIYILKEIKSNIKIKEAKLIIKNNSIHILFSLKACFIKIDSNKIININEEGLYNKYNDIYINKIN